MGNEESCRSIITHSAWPSGNPIKVVQRKKGRGRGKPALWKQLGSQPLSLTAAGTRRGVSAAPAPNPTEDSPALVAVCQTPQQPLSPDHG